MPLKARGLVLTKSQADCLTALRNGKVAKPEIAILAKLDLKKTSAALGTLVQLGLAKQNQEKRWHTTKRGKAPLSQSQLHYFPSTLHLSNLHAYHLHTTATPVENHPSSDVPRTSIACLRFAFEDNVANIHVGA